MPDVHTSMPENMRTHKDAPRRRAVTTLSRVKEDYRRARATPGTCRAAGSADADDAGAVAAQQTCATFTQDDTKIRVRTKHDAMITYGDCLRRAGAAAVRAMSATFHESSRNILPQSQDVPIRGAMIRYRRAMPVEPLYYAEKAHITARASRATCFTAPLRQRRRTFALFRRAARCLHTRCLRRLSAPTHTRRDVIDERDDDNMTLPTTPLT